MPFAFGRGLLAGIAALTVVACGAGVGEDVGSSGERLSNGAATVTKGIDVSHYDGTIDWATVHAGGIEFAFAKATESTNYIDPQFATNWSGMKAAGVIRGAYHFFDASVDPTAQAKYCLATVGTLGANDLPIVLDFETLNGQSEATAVANAVTFLAAVTKSTGKTAILYMSSLFLSGSYPALKPYTLWVANYGVSAPTVPSEWSAWTFWQSSATGTVSGISGAVDLDEYNGSLTQLGGGGSSSGGSSSGGSSGGGSSSGGCGTVPVGSITRSAVLANAEQWVAAKLQYCQSANGQPDGDPSCAATCSRQSNTAWDPYRSDCSGFVSWAWELAAPGLVTDEFAPFATTASTTINCVDMKPGDAANRNPTTGHIVMFEKWITPGTEALFLEEPGCSSSMPYAREFQSAVTCTGSTVDIAYEGDTFTAIRYDHIVDDPASCGGSSSGGSSSGSSGGSGSSSGGSSSGGSSGGSSGSSSGSSGGSSNGGGVLSAPPDAGGPAEDASSAPQVNSAGFSSGGGGGCALARGTTGGGGPSGGVVIVLGALVLAARRRRSAR